MAQRVTSTKTKPQSKSTTSKAPARSTEKPAARVTPTPQPTKKQGPPPQFVDPERYIEAVATMRASREQALVACDRADFASRRAGTPIRTAEARAHLETVWTTILQIEQQIRKVHAEELASTGARKVAAIALSRSATPQLGDGRDGQVSPDQLALTDDDSEAGLTIEGIKALIAKGDLDAAGKAIAQYAYFHGTDYFDALKRVIGNANLLDELAKGIAGWDSKQQKAFIKLAASMIDPSKTSLDTVTNLVKILASDAQVLAAMYASDDFCKDLRDVVIKSSPAELTARLSPTELGVVLAAVVQLGNDSNFSEKDLEAIVKTFDAIAIKTKGDPEAAAAVLEALGAKNMTNLMTNIAERVVPSDRVRVAREFPLADQAWMQFSLLARSAASQEKYRNTDHELHKFMKNSDFRLSAMLLEPRDPRPSSEFVALVAARVLPEFAAISVVTYRGRTSETSRERVLAALEADQQAGGNAVELFLFEHPRISFWGSDLQRQNTLLTVHAGPLATSAELRGDKDGSRAANLYLAAVISRYATDPKDVMRSFAVAAEGRSGPSLTDEGRFALAHVLSMLLSDNKTAKRFDQFIGSAGVGEKFGGMGFESFKKLVGELSDSTLGTAELMIAIGRYLNAKGATDLNTAEGAPVAGYSVGQIVDAIRDHAREKAQKTQEMLELLIGVGLVVGVAALGPAALASVAATGVAGKILAGGTVEAAKSLAKQVGKMSAEQSAKLASLNEIKGFMQVVYTVNLFTVLPAAVQQSLRDDPRVAPFILGVNLRFPVVGEEVIMEGRTVKVSPGILDTFMNAIATKVGTTPIIFKFGSEFLNALQGE
jgi:hypothetical protein